MAMSFMKIFKGKKSSNKENNPMDRSTLERASTRSTMDTSMNRSMNAASDVYMGSFQRPVANQQRHHEIHVANPYSVITAPKTTKTTRSCPGAPIDDRSSDRDRNRRRERVLHDRYLQQQQQQQQPSHYMNASLRMERGSGKRYDFGASERSSEYGSADPSPVESAHTRRFLEDLLESDDEVHAQQQQEIRALKAQLAHSERKRHEERKHYKQLKETNRELAEDLEYHKKLRERSDRTQQSYEKKLEKERSTIRKLLRELEMANKKVTDLEERILENSANDSSLLICNFNVPSQSSIHAGIHGMMDDLSNGGAGEALCSMNDRLNDVVSLNSHAIGGINNDDQNDDDDQGEDEVRVFRTNECASPFTLEQPRRSPIETADTLTLTRQPTTSTLNGNLEGIRRTLSDSELFAKIAESQANDANGNEFMPMMDGAGDRMAEPSRQRRTAEKTWGRRAYVVDTLDDTTSASSEGEEEDFDLQREKQLEKALRIREIEMENKKNMRVRYQPPRRQIAPRHYVRFGRPERTALSEFDYLQEIPTDVSGMLSSPDGGL